MKKKISNGMGLIWIICGAGRGVGKTTLALQLHKILPDNVYAKYGRSDAKTGKPGRFFNNLTELESFIEASRSVYKHIIIESNTLVNLGHGDIIIFIDGIVGKTPFRNDTEQLRTAAHLKICPPLLSSPIAPLRVKRQDRSENAGTTLADWEKALAVKISSKTLRDAICDLLIAQKRYLFGSKPTVRSKIWFEAAGSHVFGMGVSSLLENIYRMGTLQKAAKATNMSYRHAWDLIRVAESHFGKTLINRQAGGRHGGCSTLSPDGLYLLNVFKQ
ncbi:MAG: LysR family transcriptional regulator, partial [Sedimentisphaerales bacterium]|nr:LysR family transcriptional regulator [Sedimentisphaerales bacterium]